MILILIFWVLIFFIFTVLGFSFVNIIKRISGTKKEFDTFTIDECFFSGFMILSVLTGFLSILIPVGGKVLFYICILTIPVLLIFLKEIKINIKNAFKNILALSKPEQVFLYLLILFICTAVVQKITFGDTQSYHAQSIQWIQKYAVVPGLGNLHDRFAFNSMFFVISAVFTFQFKDILIFPLNGICYIVLIIKLLILYKKENKDGTRWKSVFYILILLISLLIMIPNLNTPSPDIICGILIIYIFILILDGAGDGSKVKFIHFILLNLLIFECISFKISSLFLVSTLLLLLNRETFSRSLTTIVIGILVLTSFIIRNYYLSGYLIYPYPAVDIFHVDWKIPFQNVIETKSVIEGWAKISVAPNNEVLNKKVFEWIVPWFKLMSFNNKLIMTINFLSIITFILMLIKKDFFLAKIQLIILINLVFWFTKAPDPRFAYGFIFLGFSLTFAYIVKLLEYSAHSGILKYIKLVLACSVLLILSRRIMFPVDTLRNLSLWIHPASFGIAETKDYYSNFHYRVPVSEGGCLNAEIPCTNYPLTNVFMRGNDLQHGFKVVSGNK
jgi:hypothetical protein